MLNIAGKLMTDRAIRNWDAIRRLGRLVPCERDGETARATVLTHLLEEVDVGAFERSFRAKLGFAANGTGPRKRRSRNTDRRCE